VHVMTDLETMSTSPRAAILEVAAVAFDPRPGGIIAEAQAFHAYVRLEGQGRELDPSTLLWWLQQSEEARRQLIEGQRNAFPIAQALDGLERWFRAAVPVHPIDAVWSHGATFDLPILSDAFRQYGRREPWSYKAARDTRTLFHLFNGGEVPKVEQVGTLHNALADALTQCRMVQAVYPAGPRVVGYGDTFVSAGTQVRS
jgi:hypothetical protein